MLWTDLGFQQLVSSANLNYYQQLVRDTTALAAKYISAQSGSGGLQMRGMISFAYLDSPNTTSQVTYAVQYLSLGGNSPTTLYVNRVGSETAGEYVGRAASSITAIEVAA